MVKQQTIKDVSKREDYILAEGDYKFKEKEVIYSFENPYYTKKVNFKNMQEQFSHSKNIRMARELIVPIPHKAKDGIDQLDFVMDYMKNLEDKYNIPKDSHYWIASIHNKVGKNGKVNQHAHILMSERLTLDKPIKKIERARHYKNYDVPKHEKTVYFGNQITHKIIGKNGKPLELRIFDRKDFAKECNNLWVGLVKEKHLEDPNHQFNKNKLFKNENHKYTFVSKGLSNELNRTYNKLAKEANSKMEELDNFNYCLGKAIQIGRDIKKDNKNYPDSTPFFKKFPESKSDNFNFEQKIEQLNIGKIKKDKLSWMEEIGNYNSQKYVGLFKTDWDKLNIIEKIALLKQFNYEMALELELEAEKENDMELEL